LKNYLFLESKIIQVICLRLKLGKLLGNLSSSELAACLCPKSLFQGKIGRLWLLKLAVYFDQSDASSKTPDFKAVKHFFFF